MQKISRRHPNCTSSCSTIHSLLALFILLRSSVLSFSTSSNVRSRQFVIYFIQLPHLIQAPHNVPLHSLKSVMHLHQLLHLAAVSSLLILGIQLVIQCHILRIEHLEASGHVEGLSRWCQAAAHGTTGCACGAG